MFSLVTSFDKNELRQAMNADVLLSKVSALGKPFTACMRIVFCKRDAINYKSHCHQIISEGTPSNISIIAKEAD